jgi:hypothetical protein
MNRTMRAMFPDFTFSFPTQFFGDIATAISAALANGTDKLSVAASSETANQETAPTTTLIDRVSQFIKRFVFLKNEAVYRLVALWVTGTHLQDVFEYYGYLFAHSPEPQTGKSRLLEVLDALAYRSSGILVSPSEAVLFRSACNSTQLLDEIDAYQNRDHVRAVLNAGFRKGAVVARCANEEHSYEVQQFPVYAPRALAGIGLNVLDQTTLDRAFRIEMVRQKSEERREPFRLRRLRPDLDSLKAEITQWAERHRASIAKRYDAGFPYLEQFRDRTIDITEPLAAIVEVAFADDPSYQMVVGDLLSATAMTRDESEPSSYDMSIITELAKFAETGNHVVGSAAELAARLTMPVDPYQMGRILRRYGFQRKSVRQDGKPGYRYVLPVEALKELTERYGPRGHLDTNGADAEHSSQ